MTRGKLVAIIDNNKMLVTDEFNGDMYISEGHGEAVLERYNRGFYDEEIFRAYCVDFNKERHNYDDFQIYESEIRGDLLGDGTTVDALDFQELDRNKQYYEYWFSDYVYIINLTGEEQEVVDENGMVITLDNNDYVALNFGKAVSLNSELQ